MTWDDVRRLVGRLEGCEEGTSYGTPAFRVRRTFLCRLREEPDVLVVKVDHEEKAALLQSGDPAYFTLPHYDGYPAILVRLDVIAEAELAELLELAWRTHAPAKLVRDHDA